MKLKSRLNDLLQELRTKLIFTVLFMLTGIGFAFLMVNYFPPMAWVTFAFPFYVILSGRFSTGYKVLFIIVFSFLAPALAAYWLIFFAKRIYLIGSILMWFVFFILFVLCILLQSRFKSQFLKSIMVLHVIVPYFWLLTWLQVPYVIEFSSYVNLFSIVHYLGSTVVSIIVFLLNLVLANFLLSNQKPVRLTLAGVFLLTLVILYTIDSRMQPGHRQEQNFEVLIIQGNYHKTWEWRIENVDSIFTFYENATRQAAAHESDKTRIVVWPEYAIVGDVIKRQPQYLDKLRLLARETKAYLVIGTIVYTVKAEHYDSAIIFNPEGDIIDRYDSVLPVYFNDHTEAGSEYTTVSIGGKTFGFVICYEEMIPEVFDIYSEKQVNIIVSLVNDMDLNFTPGLDFLLRYTQLRAAEYNMYILRSANTGHSVVIDNFGQILSRAEPYKQTWLVCEF